MLHARFTCRSTLAQLSRNLTCHCAATSEAAAQQHQQCRRLAGVRHDAAYLSAKHLRSQRWGDNQLLTLHVNSRDAATPLCMSWQPPQGLLMALLVVRRSR